MNTRERGYTSEDVAAEYLIKKGYSLIAKNFYAGKNGEIDLIMCKGRFIVFVEVKSLMINSPFTIYESLTRSKKRKLKYSVQKWLLKKSREKADWRMDFVGIIWNKDKSINKIEHFEFIEV